MRRRRRRRDPQRGRGIGRGGIAFAALGLGGNLPGRRATLALAVRLLAPYLADLRVASLYETEPVSDVPQGPFLNTAVVGTTLLAPVDLLAVAKAAELAAGRRRGERWGPRALDVDLLVYGDLERAEPELTLPHPRLRERRFQLEPLAEIAPDLAVPPDGATVAELLGRLPAGGTLRRIAWSPLAPG